jgi:OmpA-OmpF porin, OOP family
MTMDRNPWRFRRLATSAAMVSGIALLASCTNYSETPQMKGNPSTESMSMSEAQGALKPGSAFTNVIAKDYYDTALTRRDNKDWVDADFFSRKSIAASKGEVVLPEDNKRWDIPGQGDMQTRTQMTQQRQRLIAALDNGGRDRFTDLAARSQVNYDCWIERTEANYRAEWHGTCYDKFMSDMADLEVALRPAFHVYFDTNSNRLSPQALKTLSDAASGLPKEGTWHYDVVGRADRSGSDARNLQLSQRRAEAVRAALEKDGIAANRLDVSATGEKQLPVQTANGVKEQKNRVVDGYAQIPGVLQQTSSR